MSGTKDKYRIPQRESLSQRIYRELRRDLAGGEFGPGTRLGEERLAERYRASRTPVREALARLLSDGLIERRGNILYPVRPRLDGLPEYYDARALVELAGLDRVRDGRAGGHDPVVLRPELDRWLAMRDGPLVADIDFAIADDAFHRILLTSSGNAALAEALTVLQKPIRAAWSLDYPTPGRAEMIVADHVTIAQALLSGDLTSARAALAAHIDDSRRLVEVGLTSRQ